MMRSRTILLLVLLALTTASAWMAYGHLEQKRDAALQAMADARSCRLDLRTIAAAGAAAGVADDAPDESQLDGLLNAAAKEAGTTLSSIEPGPAGERPQAGFVERSVFLRLDALSLRQLATFLRATRQHAPSARAKLIELASPAAPQPSGPDVWAADVTISLRSAAGAHSK
jgi:hypothetical protein